MRYIVLDLLILRKDVLLRLLTQAIIANVKSVFLQIDDGVPQGSNLGPLLLSVYINNTIVQTYFHVHIIMCTPADNVLLMFFMHFS